MSHRTDPRVCVAMALVLASMSGCAKAPNTETADVGHHRVRFVLPKDWERLDHGRQQLFRMGENQISLVDEGPATPEALVAEVQAAANLWQAGRRKDAVQRIREIRHPALRFASSGQRLSFWTPWTDATYGRDSVAIGDAFGKMIEAIDLLPVVAPESLAEYVLFPPSTFRRKEVARQDSTTIHGADWIDVQLWDMVSHMNRSRVAYLVNRGYLLVLSTDHGLYEVSAPAFEALLASMEVTAATPATP